MFQQPKQQEKKFEVNKILTSQYSSYNALPQQIFFSKINMKSVKFEQHNYKPKAFTYCGEQLYEPILYNYHSIQSNPSANIQFLKGSIQTSEEFNQAEKISKSRQVYSNNGNSNILQSLSSRNGQSSVKNSVNGHGNRIENDVRRKGSGQRNVNGNGNGTGIRNGNESGSDNSLSLNISQVIDGFNNFITNTYPIDQKNINDRLNKLDDRLNKLDDRLTNLETGQLELKKGMEQIIQMIGGMAQKQ